MVLKTFNCFSLLRILIQDFGRSIEQTSTCSKSTTETVKQGVTYVQKNNLQNSTITRFSSVSVVDFEQVNVSCDEIQVKATIETLRKDVKYVQH